MHDLLQFVCIAPELGLHEVGNATLYLLIWLFCRAGLDVLMHTSSP